ncbi:hypothetical protein F9L16_15875 [Agarivorans sp. B2Z047]|uniref:hypothetical protein n=1 Tax=Agarivorans sp. B2Z047 TaxID=2652721 RepID=UPI00128DB333|nr:hypothetical protein [Agarivorans sp. B2Z047]MPW30465.1 hypothetical protein [Agarivorans sp. B2Z047]UQN42314.1 hypothetical protein LQZ07_21465 [Agarivorans sp. B2Z047]
MTAPAKPKTAKPKTAAAKAKAEEIAKAKEKAEAVEAAKAESAKAKTEDSAAPATSKDDSNGDNNASATPEPKNKDQAATTDGDKGTTAGQTDNEPAAQAPLENTQAGKIHVNTDPLKNASKQDAPLLKVSAKRPAGFWRCAMRFEYRKQRLLAVVGDGDDVNVPADAARITPRTAKRLHDEPNLICEMVEE